MKFCDLKKIRQADREGAPSSGQMLIYTRKGVLFKGYHSIDEAERAVLDFCEGKDILEVHLFDSEKEYRALASTSSRAKKSSGVIEYTASFPYKKSTVFIEEQQLEMNHGSDRKISTISVLNHISFDENGMASVDDYRMVMGGLK